MRKLLKMILFCVGLGLMGGGGWVAAVGFAYNDGAKQKTARYQVPHGEEAVRFTRDLLRDIPNSHEFLRTGEHNMLLPMGGGGILAAFFGFIFLLNSIFRLKSGGGGPVREKTQTVVSADLIRSMRQEAPAEEGGAAATGEALAIDDSLLDDGEESLADQLRDIGFLVQMSQGELSMEQVPGVVQFFRPDLSGYMNLCEGQAGYKLAMQIIHSIILRHRRTKADTTADQYKAQDLRIKECETETIVRRYLPDKAKITRDDIRAAVGRVYDLQDQAAMQQKFTGEAEDWADISLRNAKEIFALKTALEE